MKLEKSLFKIKDLSFADESKLENGRLYVNEKELKEHLLTDKRIAAIDLHIVKPGDPVRVVQIADVIQPQAKADDQYPNFPGALDGQGVVGEGETLVLKDMTILLSDESIKYQKGRPYATGKILDGRGPAADMSFFGKMRHLVLCPKKAESVPLNSYRIAMKVAGLRTAVYLASLAKGQVPDEVEHYELPFLMDTGCGKELPRLAYIMQILMNQMPEIPDAPIFYGDNIHHMLPTIVHPNEILDGALVNAYEGGLNDTYTIQNHPVIKELLARHGKDLNFVGVIATISHASSPARARAASLCAKLAKHVLGADGVVITKSGGGAPEIDMADTALACENLGVKTSILMWQMVSRDAGGNLFADPKLDAITSTATLSGVVRVPAVEKLIGVGGKVFTGDTVDSAFMHMIWNIIGVTDQMGLSHMQSIEY